MRWEESNGGCFNIDATSPHFQPLDDKHFRNWPQPISDVELRSGLYFENLSPREELAAFLCLRARCLIDNLRMTEALQCCWLTAMLARSGLAPIVRTFWPVVTIMARALENARQEASLDDYTDLDLRQVPVPEGSRSWERAAAPLVRKELERLARLRENGCRRPADEPPPGLLPDDGIIVTYA